MLVKSPRITHSKGFTLTELMVGLLVSTILVGSAISMLSTTVKHNYETMHSIRLNQEMQGALELMASEIRRAGYWAIPKNNITQSPDSILYSNPFTKNSTDITINNAKDCILFCYDHNSNSLMSPINTVTDDERYGFRLKGGAIQIRASSSEYNCNAADSNWEDLTDRNTIAISGLVFDKTENSITVDSHNNSSAKVTVRNVNITLTGHHISEPSVVKTLTHNVRVRNDKFVQ